jgi:rhamnose utilization protein RhaD (predicted bifunctional aldolase and dehydrogenase)
MNQKIKDLIEMSRFYGADRNFVIAGGGNTSFKDENTIWVKASGHALATLSEDGLVELNRQKLRRIASENYSDDPIIREDQIKTDLFAAITGNAIKNRPSVETSLHEMINYKYVVHLHPSLINGVLCSRNAKNLISQYCGDDVLFVNYTDPGYTLFKKLEKAILEYRAGHSGDPRMIMLENHGVFVGADSPDEIREIYSDIMSSFEKHIRPESDPGLLPYNPVMHKALPVIRMMLSGSMPKVIRNRNNSLLASYYSGQQEFQKISHPLTPDVIVYCKSRYIYIDQSSSAEKIIDSFRTQLPRFLNEHGYSPKVIVIKDMGVFAVEDTCSAAETVLDVFEDNVRICHYALQCGGIKLLTPEQVSFIDSWEAENYRRKVAK